MGGLLCCHAAIATGTSRRSFNSFVGRSTRCFIELLGMNEAGAAACQRHHHPPKAAPPSDRSLSQSDTHDDGVDGIGKRLDTEPARLHFLPADAQRAGVRAITLAALPRGHAPDARSRFPW